jgi:cobalt-zinc-cadmium efflux system outer membrane protein
MARRIWTYVICLGLTAIISGCASVDTSQRVKQVKESLKLPPGVDLVWRQTEKDETLVEQKIKHALQGGLTEKEAVALALLNNQGLQAGLESLGISQADLVQAGLFSNPSLGVMVRFPVKGEESGTNVELSLGLNLADAWLVPLRKDVAKASLRRATLEVAQRVLELRREVKTAFGRVYYQSQILAKRQDLARLAAATLEAAKRRRRFGYMTDLDVHNLTADAAQAEIEAARAEMELAQARAGLIRVLGLTGHPHQVKLAGKPETMKHGLPTLEKALVIAHKHRVDLRLVQAQAAEARQRLRLQKVRILKDVHLGVNWEQETGGDQLLGPELGMELPIFDQNQAQIARAEFMVRMAEKKAFALKGKIYEQINNSLAKLSFLNTKLAVTEKGILPARHQAMQYADHWAGLMQLSEVERLEAETKLAHAAMDLIIDRLEYHLAIADLEMEMGGRLVD